METFIKFCCITIGCTLIGMEYTTLLGWGLWFILIALD